MDCFEWLTWVFNESFPFQRTLFGCALWAIWSDKNKRVHERQINSGREISNNIFKYLKELDESELKLPTRSSEIVEWVPPSRALIKINFDRAFDRHRSISSSRVVARNVVGEVLVARIVLHEDVDYVFVVETLACSQAVQTGVEMDGVSARKSMEKGNDKNGKWKWENVPWKLKQSVLKSEM
ncbi:hypothetical protein Golob_000797, partial [Gossypium lobatum]|nr:hypothetical protein [Gossypium lobatum]